MKYLHSDDVLIGQSDPVYNRCNKYRLHTEVYKHDASLPPPYLVIQNSLGI